MQGTHRCCAERRLLDSYIRQGRRQGVPNHKLVAHVRRKLGSSIAVWRRTADGALACSVPCLFCSRELQRFDLRVHCVVDSGGGWFSGRLDEPGAPPKMLTGGQEAVLRPQGWQLCRPAMPSTKGKPSPEERQRQREEEQRQQQQQHSAKGGRRRRGKM